MIALLAALAIASSPYPNPPEPTTTIPTSALGTCVIAGLSAEFDDEEIGTGNPAPVGLAVYLDCALTTRWETFKLFIEAGPETDRLVEFIEQIVEPTNEVVGPHTQ